ncbi:methyltransferase [Pseudonocardia xinjiangensis]|uniref:methyltransferase n=1 Tax=Pseudonocardia xinjiangensis TaxID=75289 RepID=UPI003D8B1FDC
MNDVEKERARLVSFIWDSFVPHILYSLVSLGIVDLLADGAATTDQLAERSGTHGPSLYRLLRVAVSLNLVSLEGDLFALSVGGELLRPGVAGSVRNTILLYGDVEKRRPWGELNYSVRTGRDAVGRMFGQEYFEQLSAHPEHAAVFNETMAEISRGVARSLHELGISWHGRIADVGGGSGALLAGVLAANPQTLGLLYDTESGLDEAEATLTEAGVRDRCEIVSGDFFESVPGGCDAYLLKHIVHDWDDERATTVLTRCRESMTADARLYLIESVVPTDPAAFDTGMLVRDLNMLIKLPGRERTQAEFTELLAASGLKLTGVTPLPSPGRPYSLLAATPA